jgi:folate-binding protein YgfZ
VLAVSGPLRQKFLHNLLSNEVQGLRAGEGRLAALMDARGHLQAFLRVLAGADTVWLEAPAEGLPALEQTLVHYRVAAPVRFKKEDTAVFALLGPHGRDALARVGAEVPDLAAESHAAVRVGAADVRVVAASDVPSPALVLHVPAAAAAAVSEALTAAGAAAIGRNAFDVLRIEQGRPWYGVDVAEDNLLHETGLVRQYHSSTKGCYVGQEVIARLEARGGHVNKLLRGLRLGAPVAAGAAVRADDREVGRVTTAGVSPRLGPIALAYVHRSRFEPGTPVEVNGVPATVVAPPFEPA